MRQRAALIFVGTLLGVVVAGCGGGGGGGGGGGSTSKAEYQQQMQTLGQELSASFSSLSSAKPTDLKSSAALFDQVGDALDQAGDKLAEIEPPSEVADAHQKLVDGAHQAADEFHQLTDRIKNAKPSELPQLLDQLNAQNLKGFKKLQQAVNELKAKGYQLGQLGS